MEYDWKVVSFHETVIFLPILCSILTDIHRYVTDYRYCISARMITDTDISVLPIWAISADISYRPIPICQPCSKPSTSKADNGFPRKSAYPLHYNHIKDTSPIDCWYYSKPYLEFLNVDAFESAKGLWPCCT